MRWPKVKLDSIKADVRYAFVGGPFGSNLTTRDYVEEGIPARVLPIQATFCRCNSFPWSSLRSLR